jgi:ABC-type uncharacterized transport system permease subunit
MNDSYWRTVGMAAVVGGVLLLILGVMTSGSERVNEIVYGTFVVISGTGILARPAQRSHENSSGHLTTVRSSDTLHRPGVV